jgi:hypothetical protein
MSLKVLKVTHKVQMLKLVLVAIPASSRSKFLKLMTTVRKLKAIMMTSDFNDY